MIKIPRDILELYDTDDQVKMVIDIYREGELTWTETLQLLVIVLAKQKRHYMAEMVRVKLSPPKKYYVNMGKKEIEKLMNNGEIQLMSPVYEDVK